MRLGGFVIHGNNIDTLQGCLTDLREVCDEVVAVDSNSSDGSSQLVAQQQIRSILHPWEGFGAARAIAAQALAHCDYLFYLDADERLAVGSAELIRQWKASGPTHSYYRVHRRDWAELSTGRFLFRTERRKRLIRKSSAIWGPEMLVHEALPSATDGANLEVVIEHRFATAIEGRQQKDNLYALLWAVQAYGNGQHSAGNPFRQPWHWFRNGVLRGALLRGGLPGGRLAWTVAGYHATKHAFMKELEAGAYPELVAAWRSHDYRGLLTGARAVIESQHTR